MRINEGFVELGELLEKRIILSIQDGNHGEKHPKATDYVDDGIPFIMANNLTHGSVDIEGASKIPFNQAEELRIGFSVTDDVLLTHKGTVGNTAIVGNVSPYIMLTPQVTYYRTNSKHLNNYYLLYCFRDINFQKILASLAQQSTRPYIGITAQRKLKIFFRDIRSQIKLVEKIKPYDDLIENNRRRIQLLEESARLLYKEWFVHLRFPGHEHVKIVDGVPEGWSPTLLPEVIDVNPKTPAEKNKEILYVPMSALSETSMVANTLDFELRPLSTNVKFIKNDVLLARITPCLENGKTGFAYFLQDGEVACGSTEFIVLRNKKLSPGFIYCLARSYPFRENAIKSMTGSSGRQRVQASCFDKYKVPLPPRHLMTAFNDVVDKNFEQIRVLMQQNNRLINARNLLLPRLMNGELTL